jgi:hypothetical protein
LWVDSWSTVTTLVRRLNNAIAESIAVMTVIYGG